MTDAPQILEVSQRILAELEEFRFDNVIALLNKVSDTIGTEGEIEKFETSVIELIENGLVVMSMECFHPRSSERLSSAAALEICKSVREWVILDEQYGQWRSSRGKAHLIRLPNLTITEPGLALADSLLNERGYQWWRKRS